MIGDRRTRLDAEKINKLMFLQKNLIPLKHMFDSKNGSTTIMAKENLMMRLKKIMMIIMAF
jgi:hypothetical protein